MLAMITLRPQIIREIKALLLQHQKLLETTGPHTTLTPSMQHLEGLLPQEQIAFPYLLDAIKRHLKEETHETLKAIQERIGAVAGNVPMEVVQMITSYDPRAIDEQAFMRKNGIKPKRRGRIAPILAELVLGLSLIADIAAHRNATV